MSPPVAVCRSSAVSASRRHIVPPPTRRTATCTPRSTAGRDSGRSTDRIALETILAAAKRPRTAGSHDAADRFVIYTSGLWVLGPPPEPAAEDAPVNPIAMVAWRPGNEDLVLGAASESLRTMVVRPGVVYGGGNGLVGDLFKSAMNGLVRVIGDGNNHWPLVYDRDLADLYARLAARPDSSRRLSRQRRRRRAGQRYRRRHRAVSAGQTRRPACADRRSALEDRRLCRRAVTRPARPQPARPGDRVGAEPPLRRRQRRAAARRVAGGGN